MSSRPAEATAPPTNPPVVTAPPALSALKGDEELPEPWRTRFRTWLSEQKNSSYVAVTAAQVVSNAVTVVLQRQATTDGVCLQGPSRLDLIENEGAPELTREIEHFGDDCCPGTDCTRTSDGWNLRYLSLLAAKNWQELALLLPAQRKLDWVINGDAEPKLTRKDVAAGRFSNAPNCGLMYNVPSCDALDEKSNRFNCRCDGGGYHVTYAWEREGSGFVLVAIAESSH